jgi:hypothetical protein
MEWDQYIMHGFCFVDGCLNFSGCAANAAKERKSNQKHNDMRCSASLVLFFLGRNFFPLFWRGTQKKLKSKKK